MSENINDNRRLPLGRVCLAASAMEVLQNNDIAKALLRHSTGDWGEGVSKADWELNNHALKNDERVLSIYSSVSGVRFWVLTEADRSYTTILLPNDY